MIQYTLKILKLLNARQKKQVLGIAFMMLAGGFMESLSVSLILPLITAVMDSSGWQREWYAKLLCSLFQISDQKSYIEVLLVLLIFLFIFKNVYLLFEYHIQYTFTFKSRFRLQTDLMHRYISRDYAFFLKANSGEIIRIVTGDSVEAFGALDHLLMIYTEGAVCVILGATIFVMSPAIAAGLILILGIELFLIAYIIKPVMKRMGNMKRDNNALAYQWLLQAINGIKSIKVSASETFFENNFKKYTKNVTDAERKNQTLANLPRLLIEAFTISGVLFMLLLMVAGGMDIQLIVPQLSAFVVAAIRLLPSMNRISTAMNQLQYLHGGVNHVLHVLYEKSEYDNAAGESALASDEIKFEQCLELKNITFAYQDSETKTFDQASLMIRPGQSVGIVGASGAGKTTAIDLILGLLKPSSGEILADGSDISKNMKSWLKHLSYVPQQIFLMDASIRENIKFGNRQDCEDDHKIWKVLSEAKLDEFVKSLPQGLDTVTGEQGVRLSGGQRQRIGIARALYTDPEIIFFDEATSALDCETELAIMDSIQSLKGKKTLVIIAHRLSSIRNCDCVYRVSQGGFEIVNVNELDY